MLTGSLIGGFRATFRFWVFGFLALLSGVWFTVDDSGLRVSEVLWRRAHIYMRRQENGSTLFLTAAGSFTDVETKSSKIPSLETLQPKTSFYPFQPLASVMSVPAVDPVSKYWCLGLRRRRIIVMDQKTTQGTSKLTLLRRDRFSIFHWQFPGVLRASGFLLRKASSLAVLRGLTL